MELKKADSKCELEKSVDFEKQIAENEKIVSKLEQQFDIQATVIENQAREISELKTASEKSENALKQKSEENEESTKTLVQQIEQQAKVIETMQSDLDNLKPNAENPSDDVKSPENEKITQKLEE